MPVLSIENLSGGYGEVDIHHEISLEINTGEIVVVIGPNGAGKSTAMKAVFGLLRLSGGQRQMVAMGKALMLEPTILMLDEPTAGLSPIYRNEIFQIIRQINASGVPILMVEQNAKQSLAIANRGYVFVDGRNRTTGKGIDLLNDPEIAKMFLGG